MLVPRVAFLALGGLDEGYFLHVEDIDLCVSMARAGWRILLVPAATAWHAKGASGGDRPLAVEWHKHRGMVRFYRKVMAPGQAWPLRLLIPLGVWVRFVLLAGLISGRRLVRLLRGRRAA